MENRNIENTTDLVFQEAVLSAFKELVKQNRIVITPITYPGRGWIDIHVIIDKELIQNIGVPI